MAVDIEGSLFVGVGSKCGFVIGETGELHYSYSGHYNEIVVGVAVLGQMFATVGLDGTIRR